MKHIPRNRWVQFVALLLITVCTTLLLATLSKAPSALDVTFDRSLYDYLKTHEVIDPADLRLNLQAGQEVFLPLVPPDPDFTLIQGGGLLPFDPAAFSPGFVSQLVPVEDNRGIITYPVTVIEDASTFQRTYQILNAAGFPAAVYPCAIDYDPLWYVILHYPNLYNREWDNQRINDLKAMWDPARVVMKFSLIEESELIKYIWALSYEKAAREALKPLQRSAAAPLLASVTTDIKITSSAATSNALTFQLALPAGVTNLGLYRTTSLLDPWWNRIATTNAPTNSIAWSITLPQLPVSFYRIANEAIDSDSDGYSDAYESMVVHSASNNLASYPVELSGSIVYTGAQDGAFHVIAVTNFNNWTSGRETILPSPGPYVISNAATLNSYYLKAWCDDNNNQIRDSAEAGGWYTNTPLTVTQSLNNLDITLHDPTDDGDQLPDDWEILHWGNLLQSDDDDPDNDGLTNLSEYTQGTDPTEADSDSDGISDGNEVYYGHNPLIFDSYNTVDFIEAFESDTCITGELDGQNGWDVSAAGGGVAPTNAALVQTNTVYEGNQALLINSPTGPVDVQHLFLATNNPVIWVDMQLQAYPAVAPTNLSGNTALLYINADGQLVVYDRQTWPIPAEGWVTLAHSPIEEGEWARLTVKLDYANQTWLLCLDGQLVAENLGFASSADAFTAMQLRSQDGGLDNFSVSADIPADLTLDGDLLPDRWELDNLGSTEFGQDDDPDNDGLTNLQEYNIGTHPNLSDSDQDGLSDGTEIEYGKDPATPNSYQTLPFVELFETNTVQIGSIHGQNLWESSPTNSVFVQTNEVYDGDQALGFDCQNGDPAIVRHLFACTSDIVWMDLYIQAEPAQMPTGAVDAAIAMLFNGQGFLQVYDGSQSPGQEWLTLTNAPAHAADEWVRLTTKADYAQQKWLVCMDGTVVATNLGFASSVDQFTAIELQGSSGYSDDMAASITPPVIGDTDSDGLDDAWELHYFGNLEQGGVGDYDGDGLNNAGEAANGASPLDSDTDNDGLTDGDEVHTYGTNALNADTDEDGISDGAEASVNLDPLDSSDGWPAFLDAREHIAKSWMIKHGRNLSFTNTPGSLADLADLGQALNQVSDFYYEIGPLSSNMQDVAVYAIRRDFYSIYFSLSSQPSLSDIIEEAGRLTFLVDAWDWSSLTNHVIEVSSSRRAGIFSATNMTISDVWQTAAVDYSGSTTIQSLSGPDASFIYGYSPWGSHWKYLSPGEEGGLAMLMSSVLSMNIRSSIMDQYVSGGVAAEITEVLVGSFGSYPPAQEITLTAPNQHMQAGNQPPLLDDGPPFGSYEYGLEEAYFYALMHRYFRVNGDVVIGVASFDNVWDRNLTHSEDQYPDYKKCIAVQHSASGELDLLQYLKIEPEGYTWDDIKDNVELVIAERIFDGSPSATIANGTTALFYDQDDPDDVNIYAYEIEIRLKSDASALDRLIVVIYSHESAEEHNDWLNQNAAIGSDWWNELPPVYSSITTNMIDPEPTECDPQRWEWGADMPAFYHFNAALQLRSEQTTPGGHGHQACYDNVGNLITGNENLESLASAGTADFRHPDNLLWPPSHSTTDVRPFLRAAQMDGNPVEALPSALLPANMSHPLIRIGDYLDDYYNWRPPLTANAVPYHSCTDTNACSYH